jgi:hypothetical protein
MSQVVHVGNTDIRIEGRLIRTARLEGEKYRFLDDPDAVIEGLRNCGTRIDLFTFMQRVTETAPKYTYPMEWDNFAALPITTFSEWWNKQIRYAARNHARQAEKKGVTLREVAFDDALVKGIWEIYNETPVRQSRRFPHYGMSLEQVHKYAETFLDESIFLGAFLGDKLVGFAKLTMDETRTQAGLMHILSRIDQRDKAPTNALIAHAVQACADRNIAYLVYSNFAYGKKQSDRLSDFKESNGFQRIDVPRYYVPLTAVGSAAFRFGLHHKLIDLVPESIMAKLRDYRRAYYSWKLR